MRRLAAAFLLAAVPAGCVAPPMRVTFVDGPSDPVTLQRLARAWDRYVEAHGEPSRAIREVFVFDRPRLPQPWQAHTGWCAWSNDGATIYLADVRSFFHELHHANVGDADHEDPSWSRMEER